MEIIRRARAGAVAAFDACGAFEWVALSYLGFSGLLMILFHKNLLRAGHLLEIHASVVAIIFALVISARRSLNAKWGQGLFGRILRVVRDWYPQAIFLFCFEELGALEQLVHQGWREADRPSRLRTHRVEAPATPAHGIGRPIFRA